MMEWTVRAAPRRALSSNSTMPERRDVYAISGSVCGLDLLVKLQLRANRGLGVVVPVRRAIASLEWVPGVLRPGGLFEVRKRLGQIGVADVGATHLHESDAPRLEP